MCSCSGGREPAAEAGAERPSLEIFDDGSLTTQSELRVAGAATVSGGLTLVPSWGQRHGSARKLGGSASSSGDDDALAPPVALLVVEAADGAGSARRPGRARGALHVLTRTLTKAPGPWLLRRPCLRTRALAAGAPPSAALFDDGSLDVSSASLSGSLSVQGEAMHFGGLTLVPPPLVGPSTLHAAAGVASASSASLGGQKVPLFRVGPRPGWSSSDDDAGECARACAALLRASRWAVHMASALHYCGSRCSVCVVTCFVLVFWGARTGCGSWR